jgi:DNA polymerase-3 subunit epsilon
VTLRFAADHSGVVGAPRIDELAPADLQDSFGVFHSAKDARKALTDIARARELCLKVLGLEQSEGSCFALQVGKCRGACTGKEPLVLHQMRVQLALSALKIRSWPFPGRIGLREADEVHVLEHWTYLGTARSEEELADLSARAADIGFDVDVYKVLMRHFSSHARLDWQDLRAARDPRTPLPAADVS